MKCTAIVLLAVYLWNGCLLADEPTSNATDATKEVTTQREDPTVELSGVFQSTRVSEVKLEMKHVASLTLKKVVPHGTKVENEQSIVWFDTEQLDKQLEETKRKVKLAELDMEEAEFDHQQFLQTQELDRAAANQAWQAAKQAYDNYVEFDRDYDVESAKFSRRSAREQLEYALEDLRQLERMYKEDELTEESEELVLDRARRNVESIRFRLRSTEEQTERQLSQSLPRERKQRESTYKRAEMEHDKALLSLRIARQKRNVELAKKKQELADLQKELTELRDERMHHVLVAPQAGIVYHGQLQRGQLPDKPSSLEEDTTINKGQTILTIVGPGKLRIHADVPESDIAKLSVGMRGVAVPTSYPETELSATIETLDSVPYVKGKFGCVITVKLSNDLKIVPGMTCQLKFKGLSETGQHASPSDSKDGDKTDGDSTDDKKESPQP
ncbi:MAG: HlyD family efflux transporter periplasmic adaptor subunit [Planctomycetales bacterium]|nr:HlyD family efflux transporter periplasmic adaptor subunit [Planctomycetales bacterium]